MSRDGVSQTWRRVATLLASLAFPVVWYGCEVLAIWIGFTKAMASTPKSEEIYIWRRYDVALGDTIFFAVGLWFIHLASIGVFRRRWQRLPDGFTGLASAVTGAVVFEGCIVA